MRHQCPGLPATRRIAEQQLLPEAAPIFEVGVHEKESDRGDADRPGHGDSRLARLRERDVRQGDRVLVMVRQGLPLIAAAFALFKLGAVPVIIDPGMGRKG